MIDGYETVVRLKDGLVKSQPREHFGTRTDVICARSHLHEKPGITFWHFAGEVEKKWAGYYAGYGKHKPSTGLSAVFCAIEYLTPSSIALIGFDRLLRPEDDTTGKWYQKPIKVPFGIGSHDAHAEAACLRSLPVQIVDLAGEHGEVHRL